MPVWTTLEEAYNAHQSLVSALSGGQNDMLQIAQGAGAFRIPDLISGDGEPRDSDDSFTDTPNPFTGSSLLFPVITLNGFTYRYVAMKNGVPNHGIGDSIFTVGEDITDPNKTAFSVFKVEQTWNSESMVAGSSLFGSNSANYANILWHPIDKRLYFRSGTTNKLWIDTNGSLTLLATKSTPQLLRWVGESSGVQVSHLAALESGADSSLTIHNTASAAGGDGRIYMDAANASAEAVSIELYAIDGAQSTLKINKDGVDADTYIMSAADPTLGAVFVDGANSAVTIRGALTVTKDTESTSVSTGSVILSGGLGMAKRLTVGDKILVSSASATPLDFSNTRATGFSLTLRSLPSGNSAANDVYDITYNAKNSAGTEYNAALLRVTNLDPTSTSEDSSFAFFTRTAGAALAARLTISSKLTILDATNVAVGTGTGTIWGETTSQKQAWWGKTPIIQPASANQAALTNSTGGAYNGTLVDVTTALLADPAKINDNFTDIFTLVNEMRNVLLNTGIMKGAA